MRLHSLCRKIIAATPYRVEISHITWYSKEWISYENSPEEVAAQRDAMKPKVTGGEVGIIHSNISHRPSRVG